MRSATHFPHRYRTILIDRPGRGWSEREAGHDFASPQRQADMVAQALGKLGVRRAIVVGHSWGGALATAFAIRHPELTAGLVLLAPTSHPWKGGVSWYYTLATTPLIGPLFAHTLVLPLGALLIGNATASVFEPQTPPPSYVGRSATPLVLRPKAFAANAHDMTELKANLEKLVPLYASIRAPTVDPRRRSRPDGIERRACARAGERDPECPAGIAGRRRSHAASRAAGPRGGGDRRDRAIVARQC